MCKELTCTEASTHQNRCVKTVRTAREGLKKSVRNKKINEQIHGTIKTQIGLVKMYAKFHRQQITNVNRKPNGFIFASFCLVREFFLGVHLGSLWGGPKPEASSRPS